MLNNITLGLSRATRTPIQAPGDKEMNEEDLSLGKAGINQTSTRSVHVRVL